MAPVWRNKVALDAAADSESGESLSFASLLSVQDQQPPMSHPGNQDGQQNDEEEFEFSCTVGEPTGGRHYSSPLSNMPRFGVSISARTQKPATVEIVLLRSDKKQQAQSSTTSGRKGDEEKKKKKKKKKKGMFGRRMFRSFFSPCQECRAQNSIVKVAVS